MLDVSLTTLQKKSCTGTSSMSALKCQKLGVTESCFLEPAVKKEEKKNQFI